MIIISVMKKTAKQTFRHKGRRTLVFILPIIFFSFFGFVFGASDDGSITRIVGYVDDDLGYSVNFSNIIPDEFKVSNNKSTFGELFIDLLGNHRDILVNTSINIELREYESTNELIKDVETQNIQLGLYIPSNFTESLLSGYNDRYSSIFSENITGYPFNVYTSLITYGDPTVQQYQSANSLIIEAVENYEGEITGINAFVSEPLTGGNIELTQISLSLEDNEEKTLFYDLVPGFLVFFIILQMTTVSGLLVEEKENLTMNRIKISPMSNWKYFVGLFMAQFITVSIQLVITAITVDLWGFHVSIEQWLQVYVVLQVTNFNISGISLIIASYVKTGKDSTSATSILSAPLGFLSGAFLPVPDVWVIKSFDIQIWDIIPTYHSNEAVRAILHDNASLSDVFTSLLILLVFALMWYTIGLLVYRTRVIHADS